MTDVDSNENANAYVLQTAPRGDRDVAIVGVTFLDDVAEDLQRCDLIAIPSAIDGKRVVEIDRNAFVGCPDSIPIIVPSAVVKIHDAAFKTSAKILVYPGSFTHLWAKIHDMNFDFIDVTEIDAFGPSFQDEDDPPFPNVSPTRYWFSDERNEKNNEEQKQEDDEEDVRQDVAPTIALIPREKDSIDEFFLQNACVEGYVVESENEFYSDIDGVLFSADRKILIRFPSLMARDKYVVPPGVEEIAERAFTNSLLREIVISKDVETVGDNAFIGCLNLSEINVSEDNKVFSSIDGVLFQYGFQLVKYPDNKEDVTYFVPDDVVVIGSQAFCGNRCLKRVVIGESVTTLEFGAFRCCEDLQEFVVAPENPCFAALDGVLFGASLQTLVQYPCDKPNEEYAIPDGVELIDDCAFQACKNLQVLHIPESVKEIGDDVFDFCNSLRAFKVAPENAAFTAVDGILMNRIETELLHYPPRLEDLVCRVPDGVQLIAKNSFNQNSFFKRMWIGPDVFTIEDDAFYYPSNTEAIDVSPENARFSSRDGVLFDKYQEILIRYPESKFDDWYATPETVRTIGPGAFRGNDYLDTIILNEGVLSIQDFAFTTCFSLEKILIPRSVVEISSLAFDSSYVVLCVYKNSYAHEWAIERDLPYAIVREDL